MTIETCCVCGKDAPKQCATCKSIKYCSADCQKSDWPLHKLLCTKFKAFVEAGPPAITTLEENATYKLAILFAEKATRPELIWVKCFAMTDSDDGVPYYHYETIRKSLARYMESPAAMPSLRLGHELQTYMGDHVFGDPAHGPNKCFGYLNSGYQAVDLSASSIGASKFCGDLVTVRSQTKCDLDTGDEKAFYEDITLADLRHAFEFMTDDNTIFEADKQNPYYIRAKGEWMKAVKISCSGDMIFMGKPKYREVAVHRSHKIFYPEPKLDISNISLQMGFPLLVQKMEVDRSWRHKITKDIKFDPCLNREVVWLMHNMDVNATMDFMSEWNCVNSLKWDNGIDYTVLVARKDMKELTTQQVEAFINYIKNVVVEYMIREDSEHKIRFSKELRQQTVDKLILSDDFKDFFNEFKEEKAKAGDASWAEAKFPGDV
jgi:hypothetical protein